MSSIYHLAYAKGTAFLYGGGDQKIYEVTSSSIQSCVLVIETLGPSMPFIPSSEKWLSLMWRDSTMLVNASWQRDSLRTSLTSVWMNMRD